MYSQIGKLSVKMTPSINKAGTNCAGLIYLKAWVRCWPHSVLIGITLYSISFRLRAIRTLYEHDVLQNANNFTSGSSYLANSSYDMSLNASNKSFSFISYGLWIGGYIGS